MFRYNVDCAASTGLYGGAEGAFGSNAGGAGGEGADAGAGKVFYQISTRFQKLS